MLGHGRQRGFTYLEVLVSMLLIAIVLVPALDALQSGIQAGTLHREAAVSRALLAGRLEQTLSEPFSRLSELASLAGGLDSVVDALSDAPGTTNRRLVHLAHYDAETQTFSGTETGLLWVRVVLEENGETLETLSARSSGRP